MLLFGNGNVIMQHRLLPAQRRLSATSQSRPAAAGYVQSNIEKSLIE